MRFNSRHVIDAVVLPITGPEQLSSMARDLYPPSETLSFCSTSRGIPGHTFFNASTLRFSRADSYSRNVRSIAARAIAAAAALLGAGGGAAVLAGFAPLVDDRGAVVTGFSPPVDDGASDRCGAGGLTTGDGAATGGGGSLAAVTDGVSAARSKSRLASM